MNIQRLPIILITILLTACQPAPAISTPLPPAATQRPTPTSTSSPSPTPAPPTVTPTLPAAPRTFTEQFDGALPFWTFKQIDLGGPDATPTMQAGSLVFDLSATNEWVYALYSVPDYADIRLDAQVEDRAGQAGAVGLVCRYTEEQGWFEFNIYADQTYEILYGKWLSPGLARYTPLFRGVSPKIKSDANELGLECQGNTLTPFINGTQMRIWTDNRIGLKEGQVGISAASFAAVPFTVAAYDWVKVSQP